MWSRVLLDHHNTTHCVTSSCVVCWKMISFYWPQEILLGFNQHSYIVAAGFGANAAFTPNPTLL